MTPGELSTLVNAYAIVAAAETARRQGVFDYLEATPSTAAAVTEALGLHPRTALRLLEVLRTLGVLAVDTEGRYFVTQARHLIEALHLWDDLDSRLASGSAELPRSPVENADRLYPKVVGAMADAQAALADEASVALSGLGRNVIDVGAGAAPWSLALAAKDPHCRVTIVDRPGVLAVARARAEAAGCLNQFEFVAADIGDYGFDAVQHDLALLGNVCHLFGDAENSHLIARLFASLRPGGTLAIIDSTPEDYSTGLDEKLHALSLALRTSGGEVHAFSRYDAWLRRAGFVDIERTPVGDEMRISIIRGRRPPTK